MAAETGLTWEPVAAERAGEGQWRVLCATRVGCELGLVEAVVDADEDVARRFLSQHGIEP